MKTLRHAWACNRLWLAVLISLPWMAGMIIWNAMVHLGHQPREFLYDPWFYAVPGLTLVLSIAGLIRYHYWLNCSEDMVKKVERFTNFAVALLAIFALVSLYL